MFESYHTASHIFLYGWSRCWTMSGIKSRIMLGIVGFQMPMVMPFIINGGCSISVTLWFKIFTKTFFCLLVVSNPPTTAPAAQPGTPVSVPWLAGHFPLSRSSGPVPLSVLQWTHGGLLSTPYLWPLIPLSLQPTVPSSSLCENSIHPSRRNSNPMLVLKHPICRCSFLLPRTQSTLSFPSHA